MLKNVMKQAVAIGVVVCVVVGTFVVVPQVTVYGECVEFAPLINRDPDERESWDED